ncbi:4-hydroxy-2-oxoheptanedioate aldolase [Anaerolineae bacterium]|nr:4-hydroxy-2-oxoheptanedioate aldolase [Anaerolineae bacterium]
MSDLPRLNGVIKTFLEGKPAFVSFAQPEISAAIALSELAYDGVVFEMEHNPYDIKTLQDCLQNMLNRRQILQSNTVAPKVTPMVRIPPNGGEQNQWLAKQVLDVGVYGVVWPHVSTVEDARNAVSACRYPRPKDAPRYDPPGLRGDQPSNAARYWGISESQYRTRADVWPLAPDGEVLVILMIEEKRAIENLPKMLEQVPGIGVILIGEGDLSVDLGYPRQYDHPTVTSAVADILSVCKNYAVPCGHPHVNTKNVEGVLQQGFRWLMAGRETTTKALEMGRQASGRN